MKRRAYKPNFKRTIGGFKGLVVVNVVHNETGRLLMTAFANEDAWRKTLETGMATFFKTSTGELWTKGETSGNFMKTVDLEVDCDGDAIIYHVDPQGDKVACHTGAASCYYRNGFSDVGSDPAPHAGPDEDLEVVEVEAHPNFS